MNSATPVWRLRPSDATSQDWITCGSPTAIGASSAIARRPSTTGLLIVPWTGAELGQSSAAQTSSAPVHGTISAPVVLGRLTVALERPVPIGETHVIQSWLESQDGRKRHTGVALFDAAGQRLAAGRAVWVELARPLPA